MSTRSYSHRYRVGGLAAGLAATVSSTAFAQTPVSEASPEATPVMESSDNPFAAIAEEMLARINALYRIEGESGEYRPMHPMGPGDRPVAYLWPFSALVSGLGARARVRQDEESVADFIASLQTLELYFDEPEGEPAAWASFPPIYGGGDRFYDDNQWLGIDFLHAYEMTGDEVWLQKSLIVWDFSMDGWDEIDHGGGIFWKENDISTKNTCSNGPAAVHAMMLYEATGDQQYLDWAIRIMEWLEATLYDEVSGVYWDHISIDGRIDRTRWSYNTGTPMEASCRLYTATGDDTWLQKAKGLAEASLRVFAGAIDDNGVRTFPPNPWFNAVLQRGYNALYGIDPDKDRQYIEALPNSLLRAWPANLTGDGLLPPDWSRRAESEAPLDLLEQAAVIEIASLAQLT